MVSTFVRLCAGESGFLMGNRLDVCHKFLCGEFLTCGALIDCVALLNSGNKPRTYRTLPFHVNFQVIQKNALLEGGLS